MPLFYCRTKGAGLRYGGEGGAAHPDVEARLDERGLADLLAFGFVLGEKTLIRGVGCLPGGSRLVFDGASGELRWSEGWDPAAGSDDRRRLIQAPSTNLDGFPASGGGRCSGGAQIGVSLSGGLDSRTIMAAVDHRGHRVRTLTVDVAGGADRAIAERIARRTNGLANHHVVENSADFFARWPAYVREMVWLTDGMYYDEACVMMPTLDLYREAGIEVVLRGHGGELARMHEAYELRVNRHVRACRSQSALKAQLFGQMNFGLRTRSCGVSWRLRSRRRSRAPRAPGSKKPSRESTPPGASWGLSPDVADQDHLTAYRAPGTSVVWAGLYALFGHRYDVVRVLHGVVGAAGVLLVFGIGRRCFGSPTGLVAAAIWAAMPTALHSARSSVEPLGTVWLLAHVWALHGLAERPAGSGRGSRAPSWARPSSRPNFVLLVPLEAVWALWQFRGRWHASLVRLPCPSWACLRLRPGPPQLCRLWSD